MGAINSSDRIAAILYSLRHGLSQEYMYKSLYKGDNNNNNNYMPLNDNCLRKLRSCNEDRRSKGK
jgi:hypothetical protein